MAFCKYAQVYDVLNQSKDYFSEAKYLSKLLRKKKLSGRRILEFGAGTGKHAEILEKFGFDVIGIERSRAMISVARSRGRREIFQGDIRTKRLGGLYDGVVSLFHVMSYQRLDEDVASVFRNASYHLKSGGLFVFDFWYKPAVLKLRPEVREKTIRTSQMEITRLACPKIRAEENIVDVHYHVKIRELFSGKNQKFEELHSMRYFTVNEFAPFAKKAGFFRVISEEFGTGRPPGRDTWSVCSIYRKGSS